MRSYSLVFELQDLLEIGLGLEPQCDLLSYIEIGWSMSKSQWSSLLWDLGQCKFENKIITISPSKIMSWQPHYKFSQRLDCGHSESFWNMIC